MLTVELTSKDLENNGQFVRLGNVARAIAKSKGVTNLLNSERKIFPRINAAVQAGALNPIDPETLEPLSKSDYGNGLVHFDELSEWGRSTKQFDFRVSAPELQSQMEDVLTIASDESTCDTAERVRNGEPIQWDGYWLSRQSITPHQAAKLAHCIDPIKWPADEIKQGQISNALRIKIQRCAEWLAERKQTWTLVELVEALGADIAPHGMKQAVWLESARLARDQQIDEMRRAGRYTLEVAAELLEKNGQARATSMLEKLKRAVQIRILPVHEPGKLERLESETVRDFYEVATWENLNTWLAANECEITWRFPAPTSQKVGAGQTAKPEWVKLARNIGEAWMLAEEKSGNKRPTVEQIARHLEGELSTQEITGARGKFLDWETIKREALTGITGRKKGENFKIAKGNPRRKRQSPIVKA